jgi:hypothetical protein
LFALKLLPYEELIEPRSQAKAQVLVSYQS